MAEGYAALFVSAFLAATILPFSSEALLLAMATSAKFDALSLLLQASVGNILGSVVNWTLGRFCLKWRDRRWFPAKPAQLEAASGWFNRYGVWVLLLAWVPIIGDPLTVVAGLLRVRFWLFLMLVAVGKVARYAVLLQILEAV